MYSKINPGNTFLEDYRGKRLKHVRKFTLICDIQSSFPVLNVEQVEVNKDNKIVVIGKDKEYKITNIKYVLMDIKKENDNTIFVVRKFPEKFRAKK